MSISDFLAYLYKIVLGYFDPVNTMFLVFIYLHFFFKLSVFIRFVY